MLENSYGLIINRLEAPIYDNLIDQEEGCINREKLMYSLCKKDDQTGK